MVKPIKTIRFVLVFMIIVLLLSTVDTQASNSDFEIVDGVMIKYNGSNERVVIPKGVTAIGDRAFTGCIFLKNIIIPSSVIKIADRVFVSCYSLTSITVDTGSKNFASKEGILFNKKMTEIISYPRGKTASKYTILKSVKTIGNWAFALTNLTEITIPSNVTTIGHYAFSGCNGLTGISIPKSVTTIGEYAFSLCLRLSNITVDKQNINYTSQDGILFTKNISKLICYPRGKTGSNYTIPISVTTIGYSAFEGSRYLTSILIHKNVISIDGNVFSSCHLLSNIIVDVENNYYTSKDGILYNKNITKIICYPVGKTESEFTIPNSVTTIGTKAFWFCTELTSVTIPTSVITIDNVAFFYCSSLTSISIPNSVTTIGYSAFDNCFNLERITIPKSVTKIGNKAFGYGISNLISGVEIYGEIDSAASTYSKENDITFIELDEE